MARYRVTASWALPAVLPSFYLGPGWLKGADEQSRVPSDHFPGRLTPFPRAASAPCPAAPPAPLRALAAASGSWLPTATPADALGGRALEEPGRPQGEGRGREAQARRRRPTVPPRSGRPAIPRLRPLATVRPTPRGSHPRLLTPSGLQRPDLKTNPGTNELKRPPAPDLRRGGGSRGGEESPRTGAEKGVAGGARVVLAPRGLGLRASAERASRGGAPRPDQSAAAAAGEWAGPMHESLGSASDRKGGPGVAVWLANRYERSGSRRVGD